MRKIDSFWKLLYWFTTEVNKLTAFHNIDEYHCARFLQAFGKKFSEMRPENHGWFNGVEVKHTLNLTFQELTADGVVLSPDIKFAIEEVITMKMFFFYPLNYRKIDRLMNLINE